jgi:hypothetical protein
VKSSGVKGKQGRRLFVVAQRHGREAKRGGSGSVRGHVEQMEEGFSSVRAWVGDVGRHSMNTAALGFSNSGRRCTPHGRGGRGLRTGEDGGVHDAGQHG